jgi:hypothetical protein
MRRRIRHMRKVVLGQQQEDDWPVMLQHRWKEENPWEREKKKKLGPAAKLQREERVLTVKGSDTKLRNN